jgi:hypothetical protein
MSVMTAILMGPLSEAPGSGAASGAIKETATASAVDTRMCFTMKPFSYEERELSIPSDARESRVVTFRT